MKKANNKIEIALVISLLLNIYQYIDKLIVENVTNELIRGTECLDALLKIKDKEYYQKADTFLHISNIKELYYKKETLNDLTGEIDTKYYIKKNIDRLIK